MCIIKQQLACKNGFNKSFRGKKVNGIPGGRDGENRYEATI
jgi:hypothetical protein